MLPPSLFNERHRRLYALVRGNWFKLFLAGLFMLLMAAADQDKFEKVLDSFFRRTLFHMQAWAETDVPVLIQHDDFVWSEGAFMHPDIYREVIIPRLNEKDLVEVPAHVKKDLTFLAVEHMDEVLSHTLVRGDEQTLFRNDDFSLESVSAKGKHQIPLLNQSAGS